MTTALVTGGNRGIGLAICRELSKQGMTVLLAAREEAAGDAAVATLAGEGLDVRALTLDVADGASVTACAAALARENVAVDVLVNNAGFLAEGALIEGDPAIMEEAIAVNLLGPLRTARAFMPGMAQRGYGRVVNVSSNWGSFERGLEGPAAYAVTKAALNALTVRLAREAGAGVKVNCMCPGWVKTRMGGGDATRTPEQGADTAVFLATLPDDGPNGGFFAGRKPMAW